MAFGSRPADMRFGAFSREIANTLALRKSKKLQQLKFLSMLLGNSRTSRSMMVGRKTNWIFHVTHPGALSVCVPR